MRILYIAYSCSPIHGSEDAIGWNVPVESACKNTVYVITKEEQRPFIERYLQNNQLSNIQFFYVDIPKIYKKIFRGHFYSGRIGIWNKRTYKLAKKLCAKEKIDIIHQVTPVEFRSIGAYGSIPNTTFVCGPVAGGQRVPKALRSYVGCKWYVEAIRGCVNGLYRFLPNIRRHVHNTDYLIFANHETKNYLAPICSPDIPVDVMTDIATVPVEMQAFNDASRDTDVLVFAVVGRLVYLKGHALLLDALSRVPRNLSYRCRIVGEGEEMKKLKVQCHKLGLDDKVSFEGAVAHTQITKVYSTSDVLIMPSFREATGSVLLEAMSTGIPVITINRFGGTTILDNETGWLYDGNTKEAFIESLKEAIVECIQNPTEVKRRGQNAQNRARDFCWKKKMMHYQEIYDCLQR